MKSLIIAGCAVFVGLILILCSVSFVGAGERGVVLHWGAYEGETLEPGIHWLSPFSKTVQKMNVQTQQFSFDGDGALEAASHDLQDVKISVSVNYHVDPQKAGSIYQQIGSGYEGNVIHPMVREIVKANSAIYTAEELVTKRAEFSDKVASDLSAQLASRGFVLERLNITNLQFSDSFNKSIEAKVTAEQDALAAKNKLDQVKFEADQRVAQAQAEAEAIKIQAQAITQQGGQSYVDLQAVQKWDGHLPTQMIPGSTLPFINVTK